MAVTVHRARERFRTVGEGRETWHAFAFGDHYDPDNTHFGVLVASNEERLEAGGGYPPHQHAGIDIVSWVLDGVLVHEDSLDHAAPATTVRAGEVQRLAAGAGVTHAEHADASGPARFVQMWLASDQETPPSYQRGDVGALLEGGDWVALAGPGGAVSLARSDAALLAVRLPAGAAVRLPRAPYVHLHVARGAVDLAGLGVLDEGDSVRVTGGDGDRAVAQQPAELLCLQMQRAVGE